MRLRWIDDWVMRLEPADHQMEHGGDEGAGGGVPGAGNTQEEFHQREGRRAKLNALQPHNEEKMLQKPTKTKVSARPVFYFPAKIVTVAVLTYLNTARCRVVRLPALVEGLGKSLYLYLSCMAALLKSQMTIQQGPALLLTEMVCYSQSTYMTMQKPLKYRLDQHRRNVLTHRKKTSTMMTITTTMKKNKKYGKMVEKCMCKFHLSFDMLQITEVRNDCACNDGLAKDMMPKSVHWPPCSLQQRRQVRSPPSKTTSYIRQGLRR